MQTTRVAAMLLAAGRGERLRPLTDATPKPLLTLRGKPLMQWSMEALSRAGVTRLVVNTAWQGEQIEACFGSVFAPQPPSQGQALQIRYSHEGRDFGAALETAGGISRALPLLRPPAASAQSDCLFWLLASDVLAPDFVFSQAAVERFAASGKLAHIWLVPNPAHHPEGDFGFSVPPGKPPNVGLALNLQPSEPGLRYTYSTIGLYHSKLFAPPWCDIPADNPQGLKAPLAPLLRAAMDNSLVSAELYNGAWTDVGTPQRLEQLNLSWRPNLRDEGDNHVLELAVASGASHIVTWNTRDFAAMELRFPMLRVATPPQLLKELSS